MSKLPLISGVELVTALRRIGYMVDHQTGSHIILRHLVLGRRVTVPNHKEIAKGTLRAIMRQTGLSHEDLLELLK